MPNQEAAPALPAPVPMRDAVLGGTAEDRWDPVPLTWAALGRPAFPYRAARHDGSQSRP